MTAIKLMEEKYHPDNDQGVLSEDEKGYNEAIDEQGNREITHERNKLMDCICEAIQQERKLIRTMVFRSQEEIDFMQSSFIADAIIANQSQIIKAVKTLDKNSA